mgnify:CR=1 FL=1
MKKILQDKDYTHLGRSGLRVSRMVLGTMNFGPVTAEKDSFAIMDKALEYGINFFDTANIYGANLGPGFKVGLTEEIIGKWFEQGGGRREKVVIATKVYGSMDRESNWPNTSKLSARHIIEQCEASLRRMKTDRIDLYQMHHVDRETPWDEIWQAMDVLIQQGKIIYVGSSNFAGWHIAQAMEIAKQKGLMGLVSEQCHYNLANRLPEIELLPACKAYGIGVICWSPLAGGVLAGMETSERGKRRMSAWAQQVAEKHSQSIEKYNMLCRKKGVEPAVMALAWLLARSYVTAPIIGPRTAEQLESSLKALEVKIDEETLKELDEIWPGPGKEAPEVWSW